MKIILLSDDAIRLEPVSGPLTIEALSAEQSYSPFHMLASALAICTFSVLHAWATHASLDARDLSLEVRWTFGEHPHRIEGMHVSFDWPSLPAKRVAAAERVAEMCTIHTTLRHPPEITVSPAVARTDSEMPRAPDDAAHGDDTAVHSESAL